MGKVECQVCGKDCVEFYCFRMGVAVYKNRYGGYWWKGKPKTKSGGLGGLKPPIKERQACFNFSDGSTEPRA